DRPKWLLSRGRFIPPPRPTQAFSRSRLIATESTTHRCSTTRGSMNTPPPVTSTTFTPTTASLPAASPEELTAPQPVRARRLLAPAPPALPRPEHQPHQWRRLRPWRPQQGLMVLRPQRAHRPPPLLQQQLPQLRAQRPRQKQPLHRGAGTERLVKKGQPAGR